LVTRTVIIGAGVSGLVRAHVLARRGEEVLLLEASERPGGVIRTEERDGFLLEWGPNTVRPTADVWGLVEELGLVKEALVADPRMPRYIDFGGRLHPLPMNPLALLGSRLLSAKGKLRMLAEPFLPRGSVKPESLHAFFARRLGPEVAERLVEPFVSGIFAGDAGQLDVTQAFPALARFERERGSVLKGALAARREGKRVPGMPRGRLSFRAGLAALPRALAQALGERFRANAPVEEITPQGKRWRVRGAGDLTADHVVVATPAAAAARLVKGFASEAAEALAAIPYPPLAVLHLSWPSDAFGRPLDGFGHLVVPRPDRRILGAVWVSGLFPDRAPDGNALLTVYLGGTRDPQAASLPEEEMVSLSAANLAEVLDVRGEPRLVAAFRYPRSIPQYDFGHAQRMKVLSETEERLPGLRFLGNYRGGISVGDVVRSAVAELFRLR